jgi:hypothetical protein
MLKHIVCMKFKAGVVKDEIEDLKKSLAVLPGKIPEIKELHFGPDIMGTERSYDFALIALFSDTISLKRYQAHEDHIPIIHKVKALSDSVISVDFEWL